MKPEERRFILEKFYNGWKINTTVWNPENEILCVIDRENPEQKNGKGEDNSKAEAAAGFLNRVKRECRKKQRPVMFVEQDAIYFLAFYDRAGCILRSSMGKLRQYIGNIIKSGILRVNKKK